MFKKLLKRIGAIFFVLLALGGILGLPETFKSKDISMLIISIILIVISIFIALYLFGDTLPTIDDVVDTSKPPQEQLAELIVENPNINLKKGEICYYQGKAQSCKRKNVVTGYTGRSSGSSIRVAKGVSIRTGGGASHAIRGIVSETYPASLYLTNQRVVLLAEKYGVVANFPTIVQLEKTKDGLIIHQTSKSTLVLTKDSDLIFHILDLMNSVNQ